MSVAYTRLKGSSGELLTARTTSLPGASGGGNESRGTSDAPLCLSHVERKSFWNSATTGPSTLRCVSRHLRPGSACRCDDFPEEPAEYTLLMFTPPTKATR